MIIKKLREDKRIIRLLNNQNFLYNHKIPLKIKGKLNKKR